MTKWQQIVMMRYTVMKVCRELVNKTQVYILSDYLYNLKEYL